MTSKIQPDLSECTSQSSSNNICIHDINRSISQRIINFLRNNWIIITFIILQIQITYLLIDNQSLKQQIKSVENGNKKNNSDTQQQIVSLKNNINHIFSSNTPQIISSLQDDINNQYSKLEDLNTKIQIEQKNFHIFSQNTPQIISSLQDDINNYYSKLEDLNTKIQIAQENLTQLSYNATPSFDKCKFILYGPFIYDKWDWTFTGFYSKMLIFPTSAKITLYKKSIVTLIGSGHFYQNQTNFISFLKDKELLIPKNQFNQNPFYQQYTYYTSIIHKYVPFNLVREVVIEAGTYIFELAFQPNFDGYHYLSLVGYGLTVKVQEIN